MIVERRRVGEGAVGVEVEGTERRGVDEHDGERLVGVYALAVVGEHARDVDVVGDERGVLIGGV